jgi:hypothetical protein
MSGPAPLAAALLAQHGGGGSGGETIMTIFLVTVLVVIWLTLGVVCWVFWRAKKREDAERERTEVEWSARSS